MEARAPSQRSSLLLRPLSTGDTLASNKSSTSLSSTASSQQQHKHRQSTVLPSSSPIALPTDFSAAQSEEEEVDEEDDEDDDEEEEEDEDEDSVVVVRAMYAFSSPDKSSLAFEKDDLILVLTRLDSGWWHGQCNGRQGWFPMNYVTIVEDDEEEDSEAEPGTGGHLGQANEDDSDSEEATTEDLWLPQTTPDGQVFYFNTRTAESSWSIPARKHHSASSSQDPDSDEDDQDHNILTHPAAPAPAMGTDAGAGGQVQSAPSPSALPTTDSSRSDPSNGYYHSDDENAAAVAAVTGAKSTSLSSRAAQPQVSRSASPASQASSSRLDALSPGQMTPLSGLRKPSKLTSATLQEDQPMGLPPLPPMSDPFNPEPTWQSLADHTSRSISHLLESAERDHKGYYQVQASFIVEAIRVMLYACGAIDKDSTPIRTHRPLKIYHRQIMAALSKLVLSAKMASSVWASEGAAGKMQGDAKDVAEAVKHFITTAESLGVKVFMVDAKLVMDPDSPFESKAAKTLSRGLSVKSASSNNSNGNGHGNGGTSGDPASNPTSAAAGAAAAAAAVAAGVSDRHPFRSSLGGSSGLLAQLDYYSKSASKAVSVLTLQVRKSLEGSMGHPSSSLPSATATSSNLAGAVVSSAASQNSNSSTSSTTLGVPSGGHHHHPRAVMGNVMNAAQSAQLVAQCHQAISQIGSLLAMVNEFYNLCVSDHPSIHDSVFLEVRISKQALYNNIASLVMSLQLSTDPMAQPAVLDMVLDATTTTEKSIQYLVISTKVLAQEKDDAEESLPQKNAARYTAASLADSNLTLVGASTYGSSGRQGSKSSRGSQQHHGLDTYFSDMDSDLEQDGSRLRRGASQHRDRSNSQISSLSNTSSTLSQPTTPGTEFSGRGGAMNDGFFAGVSGTGPSGNLGSSGGVSSSNPPSRSEARSDKLRKIFGAEAPISSIALAPRTTEQQPEFMDHDYGKNDIAFSLEGSVKSGTLPALVERLTSHDSLDMNFVATFLLTYRSFTTTDELMTLLFKRFVISPPKLKPEELALWSKGKQTPIRLRVFNILKSWLENYYMEDEADDRMSLARIKEFSNSPAMRETMSFAAVQLIKLVEKREASDGSVRKMVLNLSTQAPQPITPRNLKKIRFMELDPLEFARQLTIMEATVYNRIKPTECLDKRWMSEDPNVYQKAANIKRMITTCNEFANWLNEVILTERDVKKRAGIIKHVIVVAEKLRQLNNFSMLSGAIAGLAQSPVFRLKRSWDLVPAKYNQTFLALKNIMTMHKNWVMYREELHSVNPPCVPFVGMYLTDLVMIDDGNPDKVVNNAGHVNFFKYGKTADVIREIQQYQSVPYCLTAVPEIQVFIRKGMDSAKSVGELYDMSLALEPREEKEEDKITRLLLESGFM